MFTLYYHKKRNTRELKLTTTVGTCLGDHQQHWNNRHRSHTYILLLYQWFNFLKLLKSQSDSSASWFPLTSVKKIHLKCCFDSKWSECFGLKWWIYLQTSSGVDFMLSAGWSFTDRLVADVVYLTSSSLNHMEGRRGCELYTQHSRKYMLLLLIKLSFGIQIWKCLWLMFSCHF